MFSAMLSRFKDWLRIGPTPPGCCYVCRRPYNLERVRLVQNDRFGFGGAPHVDGLYETCPKHGALGKFTPDLKSVPEIGWRGVNEPWPAEEPR